MTTLAGGVGHDKGSVQNEWGVTSMRCRFMAELGKVVPILPLVTKADCMTIREAAAYRREVYRKLQNPRLAGPPGQDPL